jgi:hypothetical protein
VLVLVGVRSTSVVRVVVVVVGTGSFTTVVQEERTRAKAGSAGIRRISFFIIDWLLSNWIRGKRRSRMD